ncbi:hypothetical protein ALC56_03976 [Trachymyrmex septentrionalis]|uniref:Uncharacterized protein n=1 Tax=Trachymyrmex septentrionalis TaxID=34720 RepID=A0A151JZP9_9HYME|nr:hypothetical protein ALC56_03976 [Trachymyrmex septentrionalis]
MRTLIEYWLHFSDTHTIRTSYQKFLWNLVFYHDQMSQQYKSQREILHNTASLCLRIYFVPQRLKFLLTTKIPEVKRYSSNVDLANVQAYSSRNLARIHTLVILREFRLRRLECLTVFPALSRPKINMKYSSFCIKYLYKPCSNVYISVNHRDIR